MLDRRKKRKIHMRYAMKDVDYINSYLYTYRMIKDTQALPIIEEDLKSLNIPFVKFKIGILDEHERILIVKCNFQELVALYFELSKSLGDYVDKIWF